MLLNFRIDNNGELKINNKLIPRIILSRDVKYNLNISGLEEPINIYNNSGKLVKIISSRNKILNTNKKTFSDSNYFYRYKDNVENLIIKEDNLNKISKFGFIEDMIEALNEEDINKVLGIVNSNRFKHIDEIIVVSDGDNPIYML